MLTGKLHCTKLLSRLFNEPPPLSADKGGGHTGSQTLRCQNLTSAGKMEHTIGFSTVTSEHQTML